MVHCALSNHGTTIMAQIIAGGMGLGFLFVAMIALYQLKKEGGNDAPQSN
jgi:hypothetical protein